MTQAGMRDYIGSVKIPLSEVVTKGVVAGTYAVIDENRKQTGDLELRISMYDASSYDASLLSDQIGQTGKIAREVVRRISKHLAEAGFTELDLVLDVLSMKDASQQGQVSKQQLKEFLLADLKITSVTERDLEILIKTHPNLQNKQVISRSDLNIVLGNAFSEACEQAFLSQANQPDLN